METYSVKYNRCIFIFKTIHPTNVLYEDCLPPDIGLAHNLHITIK